MTAGSCSFYSCFSVATGFGGSDCRLQKPVDFKNSIQTQNPRPCYAGSMIDRRLVTRFLRDWLYFILQVGRSTLMSRHALVIENLALRSQLAIYQQQVFAKKRPKGLPTPAFRQLWVIISRCRPDWQSAIVIVIPDTVIRWHRQAFRWYWALKSSPPGRQPLLPKKLSSFMLYLQEELVKERGNKDLPPSLSADSRSADQEQSGSFTVAKHWPVIAILTLMVEIVVPAVPDTVRRVESATKSHTYRNPSVSGSSRRSLQ